MLIRMISGISKWDGSKAVNRKDYYICGDAIGDLRTTDNKLSVWKADTQEDINDAIVALALNRDSVSKLSYFLLKEEDLDKMDIKISDEQVGVAAGLDSQILTKHRDLKKVNHYLRIFIISYYIIQIYSFPPIYHYVIFLKPIFFDFLYLINHSFHDVVNAQVIKFHFE